MWKQAKFGVAVIAVSVASASAVSWATRPVEVAGHACLAVGPNVCFSGSTDWVARAAGTQLIAAQRMEMITADAE